MKNLAGNDVSIFLFRFVLRKNAISFVVNESIYEDIYPEINDQIEPVVQACIETLMRYRHLCKGETIMDGNILVDGYFEVMLSTGLGLHFDEREKQALFDDAHNIATLLEEVMDRRSYEMEQGIYPGPQPVASKIQRTGNTTAGLEALGKKKRLLEKPETRSREGVRPGLKQLRPDDLPSGVVAKHGYDHRGKCIAFDHKKFGELGKITLVETASGQVRMEAELSKENPKYLRKKEIVFKEVIATIERGFQTISD